MGHVWYYPKIHAFLHFVLIPSEVTRASYIREPASQFSLFLEVSAKVVDFKDDL